MQCTPNDRSALESAQRRTAPSPEHDAACRRCGRCCYEKLIVDSHVFATYKPCRYLDVRTNLCKAYERRFEVNPRCLDVKTGIAFGVFPADCPYVRDLPDYLPAEDGWLDEGTVRKVRAGILYRYEDVLAEMRRHPG